MATVNRIASQVLSVGQQTALASLTFVTEQMTLQAGSVQIGSAESQVRLVVRDTLGRVIKTNIINGTDVQRSVITTDDLVQSGGLTAFIECLRGSATVVLNEITGQEGQGAAMALTDIPDGLFTADSAGRAKLAAGFVTLPKADLKTGSKILAADGVNSTGGDAQVTLTGAVIGMRVRAIFGHVKAAAGANTFLIPAIGTAFESVITVTDKIVQLQAGGDLSLNTYLFILDPAAA